MAKQRNQQRTSSGAIPQQNAPLVPSQAFTRVAPMPSSGSQEKESKTCLLESILNSSQGEYGQGLTPIWTDSASQTTAQLQFSMHNGISSILAQTASRPTKGRAASDTMTSVMDITIPDSAYTAGVRFYKEAFTVEIWRNEKTTKRGEVWVLVLTTKNKDNRLRAVNGVWDLMRKKLVKLSLNELRYVNLAREREVLARSLPDPPYNFRPRTRAAIANSVSANVWQIEVPGRDPWVFTNALAQPGVTAFIEKLSVGRDPSAEPEPSEQRQSEDGAATEVDDDANKRARMSISDDDSPPRAPRKRGRQAGRGAGRGRGRGTVAEGSTGGHGYNLRKRKSENDSPSLARGRTLSNRSRARRNK